MEWHPIKFKIQEYSVDRNQVSEERQTIEKHSENFNEKTPGSTSQEKRNLVINAPRKIQPNASNMGFNIYDDVPTQELSYNQDPRSNEAIAETIFNQHAQGDIMNVPGWYAACHSLTRAFPKLVALIDPAMVGRGFELFDLNGDGILDLDEFVGGVRELLEPTSVRAKSLAKRLYAGRIHEGQQNFSHVKTVAVIGAGVAGLQTARALSKVGLAVTIYESRGNVGGVWRENYIDFGEFLV